MDDQEKRNCRGHNVTRKRNHGTVITPKHTKHAVSSIKVFYANIDNSIMSKYDALIALNALECFDMLALTEMKPKVGIIPDHKIMELPGYNLFTSNFSQEATRGTGIYVRKEFLAK